MKEQGTVLHAVLARTRENGGTTYSFTQNEFLDDMNCWFYPTDSSLTVVSPMGELEATLDEFMKRHEDTLSEIDRYLGTWVNPETGNCHIDINTCQRDKSTALADARLLIEEKDGKILAIYNPHLDQSVDL